MEKPTVSADESAVIEKKKRSNAEQDQRIANEISEALAFCLTIEADQEISTFLEARGVDSTEITTAKSLHDTAQQAFATRQGSMSTESSTIARANTNATTVKKDYADFREICRARLVDKHLQISLGLSGTTPTDRQKMITLVRSSYQEAKKPEIQALIGKSGYTASAIDTLLETVATLEADIVAARDAAGSAKRATEQRNTAVKALRTWVSTNKRVARRALRDRLDLLGKLGL